MSATRIRAIRITHPDHLAIVYHRPEDGSLTERLHRLTEIPGVELVELLSPTYEPVVRLTPVDPEERISLTCTGYATAAALDAGLVAV